MNPRWYNDPAGWLLIAVAIFVIVMLVWVVR